MGDLHEIVEVAAVGRLFAVLAIVGPIAGLLIGAAVGARRQQARRSALQGALVGLLGTLNWLLWRVYNALTDRMGLDTVQNLVVNLILFVVVGAGIGLGIGLALRRAAPPETEEEALPNPPQRS